MKELIVHNSSKSPVSEAYRGIRTNIQFANVDNNIKTILMTSAAPGEGKTTTLCNVAMTMADAGHKVIIIDCDLRKPRIHKFFEISNKEGITDVLLKGEDFKNFLKGGFHPNLEIITSGKIPSNPSEILYSNAMKNLIEKIKMEYDFVFIDTPPVIAVTDAVIMSGYIDGVVLVCASGKTEVEMAKKAKEALRKVNANILGVVLNRIPVKGQKYANYYYYSNEEGEK
ncbi:MAG: CpsD/CapB family tyrosine-protein kinase [Lachnospiraceae bacterium]|nr:CpsD/CapB family tyrosine-protein kinase [Lachnospiraceae bacterium]